MCGLSGTEFVVVLLVTIIVLGPEKLPDLLKWAGRTMKEVRRLTGDLGQVSREIQQTTDVDAIRKQIREELQLERVRQVRTDAESEIDAIRARIKDKDGEGDRRRARSRRATEAHAARESADPSEHAQPRFDDGGALGEGEGSDSGPAPDALASSAAGGAIGAATASTAASTVGAADDARDPVSLPKVRPAPGAVARTDLGGPADPVASSALRIRDDLASARPAAPPEEDA